LDKWKEINLRAVYDILEITAEFITNMENIEKRFGELYGKKLL
jgi:hypothetical protein